MKNKKRNQILLITLIFSIAGAVVFLSSDNVENDVSKSLTLTTVEIKKGDLEKKEEYNGTIRQVDKSSIKASLTGVVTYLPEEGEVIGFGEVLYAVDGKPVILLEGMIPYYRTLDETSKEGPDIKQLEQSLIDMGYANDEFVADEKSDKDTSLMLNELYTDYGIETKSEITAAEQISINSKKDEVEDLEETISSGATTLVQVQQKKKALDDANENATKENAAWQAYQTDIENLEDDIYELDFQSLSDETRASKKEEYEEQIEEKKRLQAKEEGKGSVIDADEALIIENAQNAYDDALKSYNEGAKLEANLEKAKEELQVIKNP